ncbi:2-dehydropantoate 2-reductase [Azoarcus sp. L1K30]|nr:2-dehydropantoate 2-reductase [Azoarcus sp. L1K30]MBR0564699.1 2-dehydropantoate 2-reductase [Azoarcus sp. L1K30]
MSSKAASGVPIQRVLVLGAGAMGSLFGGLLAEAGASVTLVDINASHLDAIRQHGLKLVTDEGMRQVRLGACRPEEVSEVPDLIILFTKTMHTSAALQGIRSWIAPETRILSLQNGLGNGELVARFAAPDKIAVGITTWPADLCGPGHVASHGHGKIRCMRLDGGHDAAFEFMEKMLKEAGLDCTIDPLVSTAIWEKVAFNAALNSICAVTGATVDGIGKTAESLELALGIVDEVLSVARADGVEVDRERVAGTLLHAIEHHVGHKPSMLQDVLAGRPTEIQAINGAVVALGEKLGVGVARTKALLALVKLVECA